MDYLPACLSAYTIMLVAVLSPGPAVALLIGLAFSQGRGAAVIATLGIVTGSATIGFLTMSGLGLILQNAAWAVLVMKLAGATYLMWLALGSLRKAVNPPEIAPLKMPPLSAGRAYATGYLLQITNPKAIVFWIAIASISGTTAAPLPVQLVFLLGAVLISLAGHMGYALALSAAPVRKIYHRARRGIEASLGVILALFAVKLVTSRS